MKTPNTHLSKTQMYVWVGTDASEVASLHIEHQQ